MIPKPHHRLYYILTERNHKRFAKYTVSDREYSLFTALKGIRKSNGTRDALHFYFNKVKEFLGCEPNYIDDTVGEYITELERRHPNFIDRLPNNIKFMYDGHPWRQYG